MRTALLGSPGVGIQRRLSRGMITGTPAQFLGDPAATYAAVVNTHHLDVQVYVPGFGLVTEVIVFTAVPNSQATFIAFINARSKKFKVKASGTSLLFSTTQLGSMAQATILGTTSADVIASLGLGVLPHNFEPSFGVRMLGKRNWGRANVMYYGGRKPLNSSEVVEPALQHAIVLRAGPVRVVLVVDRQKGHTVASDSVHFTPERVPGVG